MTRAEYEKDYTKDELEVFRCLCRQATKVFELSDRLDQGRDCCYKQGSDYIVNSSMILLILWDGVFNNKTGGTSETVKQVHFGTTNYGLTLDNDLEVILWKVERQSTDSEATIDHNLFKTYSYHNVIKHESNRKIFRFLDRAVKLSSKISDEKIEESIGYLSLTGYDLNNSNKQLGDIVHFFAINDAISIKEQNRYLYISKLVFILSFIIMILFQFYEQFDLVPIFTILFPGIVILLLTITKVFNLSIGNNNSFLQHRLIAETLRINFYLLSVGLSPVNNGNCVVIHRESWINRISDSLIYISSNKKTMLYKDCHTLINDNWLLDQQAYFERKASKVAKKIRLFKFTIKLIFITILLLLASTIIGSIFEYKNLEFLVNLDFTFFILLLIIKTYYEFREYENTLFQSEIMAEIYTKHTDYILSGNNYNSSVYSELANKALTELHLWYLVYRDKQPGLEV